MGYKISKRFYIPYAVLIIYFFSLVNQAAAQYPAYTHPPLTAKWSVYKQQVKKDASKKMVELKSLIPGLVYDLRYASANNFTGQILYPQNTTVAFLRLTAAGALMQVQQDLRQKGLGLKIFDAYRPYAVTVKFWELIKDERYVANPARGSGHNRGIAVDLTIINLETLQELNMGTGFDNFTDTAHQTFTSLPEDILQNRHLLKSVMEKYGFKALDTEWWHYFLDTGSTFGVLNIDFKKLKKKLL